MAFSQLYIPEREKIDLFIILAGQSNARGWSLAAPTRSELLGSIINSNIYDVDDYKTLNYPDNNSGNLFGIEMSFSYNYTNRTGTKIYFEKTTSEGTGIYNDAVKDDWNVATDELIVTLRDAMTRLKAKATSLGSVNPKYVLVWIQGEKDIKETQGAGYSTNFNDILDDINTIQQLDYVVLNICNSNLPYSWANIDTVRTAQNGIATALDYVDALEMNNYTLGGDSIHYISSAYELMGDDIFELVKTKFNL